MREIVVFRKEIEARHSIVQILNGGKFVVKTIFFIVKFLLECCVGGEPGKHFAMLPNSY